MQIEATPEEMRAIRSLHRLAKKWPESLWLFSASGTLCVMKADENGNRVFNDNDGVDPSRLLDTIDISNDGGDW